MSTLNAHWILLPLQEATCRSQVPPSKEACLCPGWVQAPMAGPPASQVEQRVALASPRGQVSPTGRSAHCATLQHDVSCLSLGLFCAPQVLDKQFQGSSSPSFIGRDQHVLGRAKAMLFRRHAGPRDARTHVHSHQARLPRSPRACGSTWHGRPPGFPRGSLAAAARPRAAPEAPGR